MIHPRRNHWGTAAGFMLTLALCSWPARAQVETALKPPSLTQTPTPVLPPSGDHASQQVPLEDQPLKSQLKSIYGPAVAVRPTMSAPRGGPRQRVIMLPQTSMVRSGSPLTQVPGMGVPLQSQIPLRIIPQQAVQLSAGSPQFATTAPLQVASWPQQPLNYPPSAPDAEQPLTPTPLAPQATPQVAPLPEPQSKSNATTWGEQGSSPLAPGSPTRDFDSGGAGIDQNKPLMLSPIPEQLPVGSGLTTYGAGADESAGSSESTQDASTGDDIIYSQGRLIDPNINPPWTKRLFPDWEPAWQDTPVWRRFDAGRQKVSAGMHNYLATERGKKACKEGCQCKNCRRARRKAKREFGGWFSWGATFNADGNKTSDGNAPLGYNNFADGALLNQAWLFGGRRAEPGYKKFDWGYRFDFLFGADAPDTSAFGDETWDFSWATGGEYGFALPQLYATVGYGNWLVNFGHFYTIIGYEVTQAPLNFFYSHSYTNYYNEPFTHTGALAQYEYRDNVTFYAGYTTGWNTGFRNPNEGGAFLGGVSVDLSPNLNLFYATSFGDPGDTPPGPLGDTDAYLHSVVLNMAVTPDFYYMFQWDYQDRQPPGVADQRSSSINQHLIYTLSDRLALGARFEWFDDDSGARIGNGPGNYYDITLGVNYKTRWNVMIRPELRYDWFNGAGLPFDNNTQDDMFTIGCGGFWTF